LVNGSATLTVFLYESADCSGVPAMVGSGQQVTSAHAGDGSAVPQSIQVLDGSIGGAVPGLTRAAGTVVFTTYANMAACDAKFATTCYEFTDGTVVGQFDPTLLISELADILPRGLNPFVLVGRLPTGSHTASGCVTIPILGSSRNVMDVSNQTAEGVILGAGSCSDLAGDLDSGTADLVGPGSSDAINSLDAASQRMPITCYSGPSMGCAQYYKRTNADTQTARRDLSEASSNATAGRSRTAASLGGLSLEGYCNSIKYRFAIIYGYSWACANQHGTGGYYFDMNKACVWAYGAGAYAFQKVDGDLNSWECRR
jgi:hypothetical protein